MAVLNSAARKIYAFGSDSFHPDDRVQYGMWVYEINTNSWEVQEIHLELTDLSRSSAVWDSKGNRIIVFGGRRSDGIKNNRLIVYDDYNCIWENVRSAVDAPPVRDWHSAVWDPNEEKMYIFGGVGSSNNYYNDLWVYTPSTKYWNLLDPSGVLPPPLVAHSAAWDEVEGNMYVFGGKKHSYLNHNDIWKYNAAENAWKHLPMIGQIPEARSDHTAVWSTSQRIMYIFGGVPNNYVSPSQLMNDLWEFNPEVTPKIHEMQA
jgi:N-acetylneuraminic acid mutarotase